MAKKHKTTLFIFRRDLRLKDNTALLKALEDSETVIPCFIFDPRQTNKHLYRSETGFVFLINSLKELNEQLRTKGSKLHVFSGRPEEVIKQLPIDAVYFNHDYTPFSRARDEKILAVCQEQQVPCIRYHDALLTTPGSVLKDDQTPYTIYTPFSRRAQEQPIPEPRSNKHDNFGLLSPKEDLSNINLLEELKPGIDEQSLVLCGGRTEGLKLLSSLPDDYVSARNNPNKQCSLLSAHHKFGTISIRESYLAGINKFGPGSTFILELYWRDFLTHIAYHFPHVFTGAFKKRYDAISWVDDEELFDKWCEGRTGFPIVDAGMRELNNTGFMHNRVRMIVASFLTKDLHINWRLGEAYFARRLLDYDPAVNNGNWQWAASIGCDAQPYFRIFNPWLQQKKFDPACEYIKRWVPELKDYSAKAIHGLEKQQPLGCSYPRPVVDHSLAREKAKELFKMII